MWISSVSWNALIRISNSSCIDIDYVLVFSKNSADNPLNMLHLMAWRNMLYRLDNDFIGKKDSISKLTQNAPTNQKRQSWKCNGKTIGLKLRIQWVVIHEDVSTISAAANIENSIRKFSPSILPNSIAFLIMLLNNLYCDCEVAGFASAKDSRWI